MLWRLKTAGCEVNSSDGIADGREVIIVGIGFDKEERNIEKVIWEDV